MKIEVGEYFRTENGKIHKWSKGRTYTGKNRIIKHSKNIIDLIEVGDFVNGEPVEKINIMPDEFVEIMTTTECLTNPEYIKTILTHEQYELNCYRLEE